MSPRYTCFFFFFFHLFLFFTLMNAKLFHDSSFTKILPLSLILLLPLSLSPLLPLPPSISSFYPHFPCFLTISISILLTSFSLLLLFTYTLSLTTSFPVSLPPSLPLIPIFLAFSPYLSLPLYVFLPSSYSNLSWLSLFISLSLVLPSLTLFLIPLPYCLFPLSLLPNQALSSIITQWTIPTYISWLFYVNSPFFTNRTSRIPFFLSSFFFFEAFEGLSLHGVFSVLRCVFSLKGLWFRFQTRYYLLSSDSWAFL